MKPVKEDFRTLYCDPGESFGWVTGVGLRLVSGGTIPMWEMADEVWSDLSGEPAVTNSEDYLRAESDPKDLLLPIKRIVCEDWRLYPKEARSGQLDWDQCRTARVIGALTWFAHHFQVPLILQGADIKPAAVAAGAEELYWKPLRENRHQNDAVQHFVFFTNVELLQLPMPKLSDKRKNG